MREWVLAFWHTLVLAFLQRQEVVLIAMAPTIFKHLTLAALDAEEISDVDGFARAFVCFHGTEGVHQLQWWQSSTWSTGEKQNS